jgi:hypothetical protein
MTVREQLPESFRVVGYPCARRAADRRGTGYSIDTPHSPRDVAHDPVPGAAGVVAAGSFHV